MNALDDSNVKEFQESTTTTLEWTVRNLRHLFDSSKGEQKSKVTKSVKFGGGYVVDIVGIRWDLAARTLTYIFPAVGKYYYIRTLGMKAGLFKFSFDLKTVNRNAPQVFNTKEACDHTFSYKTSNWGWAQFAKRDAVFYSAPQVRGPDAFLIICTITSSPTTPTPQSVVPRQYVPKGLMDAVGSMLDDPMYSDIEFILPAKTRGKKGAVRTIYANKTILCRSDYFETMFKSGFAEASHQTSGVMSPTSRAAALSGNFSDFDEDARQYDDSDETDEDTETDSTIPVLSLPSKSRDARWETQSDTAAPTRREDDMNEYVGVPRPETASPSRAGADINDGIHERNASAGIVIEDVEMESKPEQSAENQDAVTKTGAGELNLATPVTAGGHNVQPSSIAGIIPGPPKTTVVVRDTAYATYFALLYYLYTDSIVFAPLSSNFINNNGVSLRSGQPTPAVGTLGTNSPSYFAASAPGARARPAVVPVPTASGDENAPRSRREWVRQWMASNPSRPPPVSAKAVYRLADKLGLGDLKQRAFQHIVRSLNVSNIPYETFSSFSAAYDEIRKVEVEFFLEKWAEIRNGEAMRTVFQQIRLGRHPGFEEIWPYIVQHLVFKPEDSANSKAIGTREGSVGDGLSRPAG
ncbi:hypothetical protein FRB99_005911, partial [Tulasnella sp. 403]